MQLCREDCSPAGIGAIGVRFVLIQKNIRLIVALLLQPDCTDMRFAQAPGRALTSGCRQGMRSLDRYTGRHVTTSEPRQKGAGRCRSGFRQVVRAACPRVWI